MQQKHNSNLLGFLKLVRFTGILLWLSSAVIAKAELHISIDPEPMSPEFGWVYVSNVDRDVLAALRKSNPTISEWGSMFAVQLRPKQPKLNNEQFPNVVGKYEILESGLRFLPQFAPMPGLSYRVTVLLDGHQPKSQDFQLNNAATLSSENTQVEMVYPSSNQIPENTLRLYIHFTNPMRRGQVLENIRLLDEHDQVIKKAFIVGPLGELWDNDQRRLTLLLDPGRIKQGVAPNRELGPALKAGSLRTLSINGQMKDAKGQEIGNDFRKTYQINAPIRKVILPRAWAVTPPMSGSNEPLRVHFTRNLDSAMLVHSLRVFDSNGEETKGRVSFSDNETEWQYTPTEPWSSKNHYIQVATKLEDVSGNNILAPMDVKRGASRPVSTQIQVEEQRQIAFTPLK